MCWLNILDQRHDVISPTILRYAKAAAQEAGLANVETRELDGGEGVLARTLEQAGLRDVKVDKVDSPLRLPTAEGGFVGPCEMLIGSGMR